MNISDVPSSSSCANICEDVQLKVLIDTFGSVCSLEDIALAFTTAGHNVEKAGEILCSFNENNALDMSCAFNFETSSKHFEESSQMENPVNAVVLHRTTNGKKPKRVSASVGSISSLLGKTYFRPFSSLKEPSSANKPLKLNVLDSSFTESAAERFGCEPLAKQNLLDSISTQTAISNIDVEEFLFSMLGDGFQLSMDSIRKVLGNCGYNAKQSMEELLSLSAKTLDIDKADHKLHRVKKQEEETSCLGDKCKKFPPQSYSKDIPYLSEKKTNLSKEVLESLFSAPDRFEEEPKQKRLEWGLNRTRVTGQKPVTKPFGDDGVSQAPTTELIQIDNMKDDEEHYQMLRKATKQQWNAMKLYYEAAIDAFTMGNHARASYCLEQGKLFYDMAREADEKSSGLILDTRELDDKGNELPLDLHTQSVNESIRLLSLHLISFASIPSFSYLKVTITSNDDETSKGKRRRKKVLQLLQDESIEWSEVEGSPGVIMIPLDEIDPSLLSFNTES